MLEKLAPYRKAIVALVAAVVSWAIQYQVADEQWLTLVTMILGAVGVYAVPNAPRPVDLPEVPFP